MATYWLTVKEAAREVGVSAEAVRQRAKAGKLERLIAEGMLRVGSAGVARWIAERTARTVGMEARYGTQAKP